jgi:hypothetical protein
MDARIKSAKLIGSAAGGLGGAANPEFDSKPMTAAKIAVILIGATLPPPLVQMD